MLEHFSDMLFFAWTVGYPELIILVIVALIVFGSQLPSISRRLGRSIKEFKKGIKDVKDEIEDEADEAEKGEKTGGKKTKDGPSDTEEKKE